MCSSFVIAMLFFKVLFSFCGLRLNNQAKMRNLDSRAIVNHCTEVQRYNAAGCGHRYNRLAQVSTAVLKIRSAERHASKLAPVRSSTL